MIARGNDQADRSRHRYYRRLEKSRNENVKGTSHGGLPRGKSFPSFLFPTYMLFDKKAAKRGLLKSPLILAVSAVATMKPSRLTVHSIGIPSHLDWC